MDSTHLICINPWRQAYSGDASVFAVDIMQATLVDLEEHGWLEVKTRDGRTITTELRMNQRNVDALTKQIEDYGVHVSRWTVA